MKLAGAQVPKTPEGMANFALMAIALAFVVYITAKGELATYLGFFLYTPPGATPATSTAATTASTAATAATAATTAATAATPAATAATPAATLPASPGGGGAPTPSYAISTNMGALE